MRQRVVGAMAEFENGRPVQVASNDPAALPVNAQPTQGGGQPGLTAENIPMLLQARSNPNLPTSQREFADKLLTRWLDESKTPDKIKTLQQLKAASGYQGSILDLEKELKAAGAINIDQRAESGEAKAAGEAAGKRRADLFAAAGSAGKTLTNLSRMEGLLNQVSQGKLAPARMNVSAWAKAMGLNDQVAESIGLDPKGAGSAQALQSLINESVVGKIGPGGFPANNFSDADALFPKNPLPHSEIEIAETVGKLAERKPRAAADLVRVHIESTFNQAAKDLQTGANQAGGAKFRAQLIANPQARANLQAAVEALPHGAERWRGFNKFLDILEATGTRQGIGSRTAYNDMFIEMQKAGGAVQTGAKVAAQPLSFLRPLADKYEQWKLGKNLSEAARILTDPRSANMLRALVRTRDGRRSAALAVRLLTYADASRVQ